MSSGLGGLWLVQHGCWRAATGGGHCGFCQLLNTRAHAVLRACLQGEVQRQKWYYMPIKYTTARAECTAWTTKPTYFMQVRYR